MRRTQHNDTITMSVPGYTPITISSTDVAAAPEPIAWDYQWTPVSYNPPPEVSVTRVIITFSIPSKSLRITHISPTHLSTISI